MVLDAAVDPDADARADAEAERRRPSRPASTPSPRTAPSLIAGCPLGAEPRQFVEAGAQAPGATGDADPAAASRGETRQADRPAWCHHRAIQAGALRHRVLAAAGPGAGRRAGRATPPGCSRSPTATPAGSRTAPTRTCSTPTWRSTAPTPRRPFEEDEVRDLAAEWNAQYPLFGAGSADRPLHLLGVGGRAHAAARAGRRGQRADPRRRQRRATR